MIVRNPVAACFFNNRQHAMWLAVLGLVLLAIQGAAAQAAKPFPVSQFSYYISDYEYELGKLSKTVTKTEAEIEADIATAEEAGNSRLAAAAMEQLLTRRPTDPSLWLRQPGPVRRDPDQRPGRLHHPVAHDRRWASRLCSGR